MPEVNVSLSYGQAWWRCRSNAPTLILRAPWCRPLFSERNGIDKPLFRALGWRLFVERGA